MSSESHAKCSFFFKILNTPRRIHTKKTHLVSPIWTWICITILTHADFKNRIRSQEKPENLDSTWSKHDRTVPKTLSISRQRLTDDVSLAKTDRLKCETTRRIRRASRMVVIQWYYLIQNFSKQQEEAATVFRGKYCWSMLSRVKLTKAHTVHGRPTL